MKTYPFDRNNNKIGSGQDIFIPIYAVKISCTPLS